MGIKSSLGIGTMNFRLVIKLLGIISILIGCSMLFSLLWAFPALGQRNHLAESLPSQFEFTGFLGLVVSICVCLAVGISFVYLGRDVSGQLFRKEAMAVVGLSWVLATLLGALPFLLSGTFRGPFVRLSHLTPYIQHTSWLGVRSWQQADDLTPLQGLGLRALLDAGHQGLTADAIQEQVAAATKANLEVEIVAAQVVPTLQQLVENSDAWSEVLVIPANQNGDPLQIRWAKMSIVDALFESQSGFSTTGATVISELEDVQLVPHCILMWRSTTHFLGGLGIIVLFVAILGQGSAGKTLMRAEIPGPSKEGTQTRMQHTAQMFAIIYCGLTVLLTLLLKLEGLSWFDAFCHAFGTMATGGFSTYNASVGHFQSPLIDYTIIVFMILAGTNFALLYAACCLRPLKMFTNIEWRTYMGLIGVVTLLVVLFGLVYGTFDSTQNAVRFGLFQVVSIITTTGYGTHDFDQWSSFGRAVLFLLMFWGGCAGSTGGGMKVIRHILFLKIMRLEVEQAFHPTVVRTLRLGGEPVEDPNLRKNVLVYFSLILVIFIFSWMAIVTIEPDATWAGETQHKLIDSASAVAATLNNIGPGLGTVGATQNYGHFGWASKLLFAWLMMLGRLEIFVILVLLWPRFWKAL